MSATWHENHNDINSLHSIDGYIIRYAFAEIIGDKARLRWKSWHVDHRGGPFAA